MSTENQSVSDTTSKDSVNTEKNTVSYETYLRVLNEAKKAKEENKAFKALEEERKEKGLKEQNEYKALFENTKAQLDAEKAKAMQLEESINNGLKISAFEKALGGKIKNSDYYQLIPFDKIPFNPETRKVDEEGAKLVASEFLKNHSALIDFQTGKMPNVTGQDFSVKTKNINEMSVDELVKYAKNLAHTGNLQE